MEPHDISDQLEHIAVRSDFPTRSAQLTEEWLSAGIGLVAIEPVLRFMESHPGIDFGQPGALVHFVERYFGQGYEGKLIESIERKPTPHTVWMLNRVVNGTEASDQRQRYVGVLERARLNPMADEAARKQISHFLGRLSA